MCIRDSCIYNYYTVKLRQLHDTSKFFSNSLFLLLCLLCLQVVFRAPDRKLQMQPHTEEYILLDNDIKKCVKVQKAHLLQPIPNPRGNHLNAHSGTPICNHAKGRATEVPSLKNYRGGIGPYPASCKGRFFLHYSDTSPSYNYAKHIMHAWFMSYAVRNLSLEYI